MICEGIDTAARITAAQARKLKQESISFVGRYLVPEAYGKALTAAELAGLRDAGLAVLLCWETAADRMKGGAAAGAADAAAARALAEKLGVPDGTAVYFACDYSIPDADLRTAERYVLAAKAALGRYEAGVYGPQRIVEFLSARGACERFWQCVAWSDRFLEAANVRQYQWQGGPEAMALAARVGFAVDMNACEDLRKAGMWMADCTEYREDDGSVIIEPKPSAPAAAQPWYAGAMAWAKDAGLIRDGRPNDPVTRAELAMVLYRIYGPEDDKKDSGMLSE